MSNSRRILLNLVFVGFIGGSLYDIVTDQEHWPFSQYPMFSDVWRSPRFSWLRLFGVRADGDEFPLEMNRFVAPLDQSRLSKALRQMLQEPDAASRVRTAVEDCLARYEVLRITGRHEGPPLAAMRLYELEWPIDSEAANVAVPDSKRLIVEVRK